MFGLCLLFLNVDDNFELQYLRLSRNDIQKSNFIMEKYCIKSLTYFRHLLQNNYVRYVRHVAFLQILPQLGKLFFINFVCAL